MLDAFADLTRRAARIPLVSLSVYSRKLVVCCLCMPRCVKKKELCGAMENSGGEADFEKVQQGWKARGPTHLLSCCGHVRAHLGVLSLL